MRDSIIVRFIANAITPYIDSQKDIRFVLRLFTSGGGQDSKSAARQVAPAEYYPNYERCGTHGWSYPDRARELAFAKVAKVSDASRNAPGN
jgi:hypothetical protein